MSFYGSVYYQLIDTFYKVVLRNKGASNKTFITDNAQEWLENQAVGRKGVFGFDTGNRWINLGTYSETKPESNEQYSIYQIYHAKPDTEDTQPSYGFKLTSATEADRKKEDGVIQLEYNDEFETYETEYDKAGHIAGSVKKKYRLPKAEISNRVDALELLVGTDDGRVLPELENEEDQNLYGYVEDNTSNINQLKNDVGDWKINPDGFRSISESIGNMNELVGTSYFGSTTFRSIAQVIGNMSNLWRDYDTNLTEEKYSLVQTILDLKERFDNYKSSTDPQVLGLQTEVNDINIKIGQPWQDALSVYTYLRQLLDKDIELDQTIADTDAQIRADIQAIINALEAAYKKADSDLDAAYKKADDALSKRLDNAEDAINVINNTTLPSINSNITAIDGRVTAHEKAWESSEANLVEDIEDLNTNLGKLSETVTNNYNELDKAIDDLETTLSNTASTDKQELQGLINELRADLGTKSDETDAFTAIKANAADIATINSKIGTVSTDNPLSVQVSNNLSSINNLNTNALTKTEASNTYVSKTALAEANYAKISDLDDYVTEEELINKGYALDSVVSEISGRVQTIEEALTTTLGMSEEFTEAEVPTDKTILRAIFDQLADLNSQLIAVQNDIAIIKDKMNELHSDNPPFPTDEEEVTSSEEEEVPTE